MTFIHHRDRERYFRKGTLERKWRRRESCLQWYAEHCSIAAWRPFVFREGWFVVARTVSLSVVLFAAIALDHVVVHAVASLIALYLIIDALVVNTTYVFITGSPVSAVRSALLTIGTYFNAAQGFAVGWVWHDDKACSWLQRLLMATYESLRTIVTVGPEKQPQRWDGKLLVMAEVLAGIYFVAVVIAIYASWARTGRST